METADVLTIMTVAAAAILFIIRIFDKSARAISSFSDYMFLVLISLPFVTGFMAVHPAMNPFSYDLTMLIHILSAEIIFVILPYSKLSHTVLFFFDRFSSEVYWKFPEGAGDKVAEELHGMEAKV
jgi:nitrate reductase gamma subunit